MEMEQTYPTTLAVMTPKIDALVAALVKAMAKIKDPPKSSENPHFQSKFADHAAVNAVTRGPLTENGLVLLQPTTATRDSVTVETILIHTSGQYIAQALTLPVDTRRGSQGVGSAITYGKRYGQMAMLNLAAEDDDGNAAEAAPPPELKLNHREEHREGYGSVDINQTLDGLVDEEPAPIPTRARMMSAHKALMVLKTPKALETRIKIDEIGEDDPEVAAIVEVHRNRVAKEIDESTYEAQIRDLLKAA